MDLPQVANFGRKSFVGNSAAWNNIVANYRVTFTTIVGIFIYLTFAVGAEPGSYFFIFQLFTLSLERGCSHAKECHQKDQNEKEVFPKVSIARNDFTSCIHRVC